MSASNWEGGAIRVTDRDDVAMNTEQQYAMEMNLMLTQAPPAYS